jgi:hypothetical protein
VALTSETVYGGIHVFKTVAALFVESHLPVMESVSAQELVLVARHTLN